MQETKKRKREKEKSKMYPANNTYYKIFKSDKTLYRDETGNFKEINNYYYDKQEKIFTKIRISLVSVIIGVYWMLFTLFYSLAYGLTFWKSIFEFADNYVFIGGITVIVFFAFKRKKSYNKNKDKE